jgi:branched-chain amino acid transport system ATP-binding protein
MRLLEATSLSKRFGGLAAISDLSFHVDQGEILGLIGPNGSGKTTLFNLITGFLSPTAGKLLFKGTSIAGLRPDKIARKGIVRSWQQTSLFGDMTTLENVIMGHHLQIRSRFWKAIFNTASARKEEAEIKQNAEEILEHMGLSPSKNELARNLPHGYQRALGVSIALAANPELLLLDEPFSGLSPQETDTMVNHLGKIRERGITLLLVEHNVRAVMGFCERIIALNFGRKIAEGLPHEIRENKDVIEAYLGPGMEVQDAA